MKNLTMTLFLALTLLVPLGLTAQTPDEQLPEQNPQEAPESVTVETESATVEADEVNVEQTQAAEQQQPASDEAERRESELAEQSRQAEEELQEEQQQIAQDERDPMAEDEFADEEELPRTASPLALLALIGLGAGGTAAGLRLRRRQ